MNIKPSSVAITGMGIVCSLGQGLEVFEKALMNGTCGIKRVAAPSPLTFPGASIAANIQGFSLTDALKKHCDAPKEVTALLQSNLRRAPLGLQVASIAALEAWQHAQMTNLCCARDRISIVVGGQNISQHYQYNSHTTFLNEPDYLSPSFALHFLDTDHVGVLSEVFGIRGEGFTVGGSSASGNMAIIHGARLIQQDLADVCLVVGSLTDLSPLEIQGFHNIGALGGHSYQNNPEKACRPFDKNHEGFIIGQGSACMILESIKSAQERKAAIYAEIIGSSIVLDGNSLSNPSQSGEKEAMIRALAAASVGIQDVQYINAHGTSAPLGDDTEVAAIKDVFGEMASKIWINSTKSMTGHCLWSAGVVEAVATVLQLHRGFVHPNLNLENPIDLICRFTRDQSVAASLSHALSNSFGFGGFNTSIVFKKF